MEAIRTLEHETSLKCKLREESKDLCENASTAFSFVVVSVSFASN